MQSFKIAIRVAACFEKYPYLLVEKTFLFLIRRIISSFKDPFHRELSKFYQKIVKFWKNSKSLGMNIQQTETTTIMNIFSDLIKKDTDEDQKVEIYGLGIFHSNYLKTT